MKVLVLDAMGVIYSVGDDVRDLLCPFVAEKGGTDDVSKIGRLYREASLGHISPAEFWKGVGLDRNHEDEYLQRHQLTPCVLEFLETVKASNLIVWGLCNDVSKWSIKLRERFGLDKYFRGFVVSGDAGVRKPDPVIYQLLIERAGVNPKDILFVDDSRKNLDAAAALGFQTALFSPTGDVPTHDPNPDSIPQPITDVTKHPVTRTFDEVLATLS